MYKIATIWICCSFLFFLQPHGGQMLQVGMRELPLGNTSESGTFLDPAYDASDRSVVTFPVKIKRALFVAASGVNCNAHLTHVLSLRLSIQPSSPATCLRCATRRRCPEVTAFGRALSVLVRD